ncbi:MAG: HD domain-containing protein [Anaerolineae bacterium]
MKWHQDPCVGEACLGEAEMGLFLEALSFSAHRHRNQRRKGDGGEPYLNHLIRVVEILWTVGCVRDLTTLVAAMLHDVLEDTDATAREIEVRFGPQVLAVVQEVTDDKSLPKTVRKEQQVLRAPDCSSRAKLVKLADKIHNLLALSRDPPADWTEARMVDYIDWSERVVAGLRGVNEALEIAFDDAARGARARIAVQSGEL